MVSRSCWRRFASDSAPGRAWLVGSSPMNKTYLFIGDYKYWLEDHWDTLEPGRDYVLNRARLYRDRRDFVIQPGDTGKPEDYPVNPAYQR